MPNTVLLRHRPKRASLLRRVVELLKRGVVRLKHEQKTKVHHRHRQAGIGKNYPGQETGGTTVDAGVKS